MKKNLLLLIPNLNVGGAQRVFHDHSVELSKDYNVHECAFNLDEGYAFRSGNKITSLEVPAGENWLGKIYFFYLRCNRLKKLKRKLDIDICISHLEGADYVNVLSRVKEKIVLCIHGSKLFDENIDGVLGWVRKSVLIPFLYNKADRIITVSKDIKNELVRNFNIPEHRCRVINNFFYTEKIERLANEELDEKYEHIFLNYPVLINVGRLAIQKNQKPLLHIFYQVKTKSKAKLFFIGNGELKDELIAEGKKIDLEIYEEGKDVMGSEYDVYFVGSQTNPFNLMNKGTLFLLPSSWEGFPMVLGEAMAAGIPIVSSDCPTGPREMLMLNEDKVDKILPNYVDYGVLMPIPKIASSSINIWAETIIHILDNKDLRHEYVLNGKKRITDYSVGNIRHKWEAELTSLTNNNSKKAVSKNFKKNILLLIPELGKGGAEHSISKLSVFFNHTHNVFLCVFNNKRGIHFPYGGEMIDLEIPEKSNFYSKIYWWRYRMRRIKQIKKDYKIDVSISFLEGANYLNVVKRSKDKVVISVRGSQKFDNEISGITGFIRKRILMPVLYGKADQIVSVSKDLANELINDFGIEKERITHIPNFYEISQIQDKSSQPLSAWNSKIFEKDVIINVGRFHIQKEHRGLVEVFSRVKQKKDCRLLLLGDGSLRQDIESFLLLNGLTFAEISTEGLTFPDVDVYFMRHQSNPYQFMSRSKLFILSSSWEGFPNVLAEAMISGVPVISTDCPTGPREILFPENVGQYSLPLETPYGWLMPLLNNSDNEVYKAWSEVIVSCMSDKEKSKAKAENARKRMEEFTVEKIFKRWEELLG